MNIGLDFAMSRCASAHGNGSRIWWLCAVWIADLFLSVQAFGGVVQGDTTVFLFVNGVYMPEDQSLPVLPLNSERVVRAGFTAIKAVKTPNAFEPGDVIAMDVQSDRKKKYNVTNALGEVIPYPTYAGAIAAFEDGTMTSTQWLCTTQFFEEWTLKGFDDSNATVWRPAVEQPNNCCPWRDPEQDWENVNAKWISPANILDKSAAEFQTSRFYCRYKVLANVSRLPPEETQRMSDTAPLVNIGKVVMGASVAQVWLNVSRRASVSCGVVDARYFLRVPTPLELMRWGATTVVDPTAWVWLTHSEQSEFAFSAMPALSNGWIDRPNIDQCQLACEERSDCFAITWYDVGSDPTTQMRCKLMGILDFALVDTSPASGLKMTTMYYAETNILHPLMVPGMLLPGTIYTSYCSAEDPPEVNNASRIFSTWEAVAATEATERTEACIDCGAQEPPNVYIHGGWATNTELAPVVGSDRSGRMFCIAIDPTMQSSSELTAPYIVENGWYNILTLGGGSVPVPVRDLVPGTQYELFCLAESDGGIVSSIEDMLATRREWRTEVEPVPIATMAIASTIEDSGLKTMTMSARVTERGYIWCSAQDTPTILADGIPLAHWLQHNGFRQKMEDIRGSAAGQFTGLLANISHEVYCTALASDFSNESVPGSELDSPYPRTTILGGRVELDAIRLDVLVQSGPALVTCKALPWQRRPQTSRPRPPTPDDFDMRPYVRVAVDNENGATMRLELDRLSTGSWHDAFCYAEELQEIIPGFLPPPKKGMDDAAILATRMTFLTEGPQYEESGWHCTVGRPCSLTNVGGQGLTSRDQVLIRTDRCPGTCKCSGDEDQWHKGAECSSVVQGGSIAAPPPGFETDEQVIDKVDPRGPWCYVLPDTCDDATPSNFTRFLVSWTACSYNQTAGRPGTGPRGFARNGIALTRVSPFARPSSGDVFYWNNDPLYTDGSAYPLCWCNGTSTRCQTELDYRLSMGVLHVSGPSAKQLQSEMLCVSGAPCRVENFDGHALFENSRLAVVPRTEMGCMWERASPFSYPGVEGFPLVGVSEPALDDGRTFSWGGSPVLTYGGSYLLCWCGAVPADSAAHRRRTNARDQLAKAAAYTCSPTRPDGGEGFLAPAGTLGVVGPAGYDAACSIGIECVLNDVPGYGLQSGDKMAVLKACGDDAPPPPGWFQGAGNDIPEGWLPGGWLEWGAQLSKEMLISLGAPVSEVLASIEGNNGTKRGVWGFPNRGISAGPSEGAMTSAPGEYRWGAPTWAFSGEYRLCWCGASRGRPCFLPAHFLVDVGTLTITGPAVLPAATQVHICLRGRRCDISNLAGTIRPASEVFIASGVCGTAAPPGAPRYGFSLPTEDGRFFSWEGEPITTFPGRYRICFCPTLGRCFGYQDYSAFAGIMSVKGPLSPEVYVFCVLSLHCNISGIWGEGLNEGDRTKVMTVCGTGKSPSSFDGNGMSIHTYNLGTDLSPSLVFTIPGSNTAGRYRLCYCPAEAVCSRGEDFFVDLGQINVGGPDASMRYLCYEWTSCRIEFRGTALRDGDRLLVAPGNTDCKQPGRKPSVEGWPLGGVSHQATDGGVTVHWGIEMVMENYILAAPGIYTLCWCSAALRESEFRLRRQQGHNNTQGNFTGCDAKGPFNVPAGSIRIAPYVEYQFLMREPDPEERDNDSYYAYMLAIPLPLLFLVAIIGGWRRLSSRLNDSEPEAPPLFGVRKAWAAAAQENAQNMFAIKQVLETRIGVTEQTNRNKKKQPRDQVVPSYLKTVQKIEAPWVRRKRERELAALQAEAEGNDAGQAEAGNLPAPPGQLAIADGQPALPGQAVLPPPPPQAQLALPAPVVVSPPRDVYAEQAEIDKEKHEQKVERDKIKMNRMARAAKKVPPPKIGLGAFSDRHMAFWPPLPALPAGAGVGLDDDDEDDEDMLGAEIRTTTPPSSGGSLQDRLDM